ncbi:helix-turn-helix domain-containing protein [Mediterraneibacter glycyrrhizinilyticus]|nr:helix-turn-helix domain-containing protein [Mediterraneibacter glycyrrhizinilyticus]
MRNDNAPLTLQRHQLIAPSLDKSLDNAKRIQLRETVAEQNGLSPRTLYRYEAAYRKDGFPGLKPQNGNQNAHRSSRKTSMSF